MNWLNDTGGLERRQECLRGDHKAVDYGEWTCGGAVPVRRGEMGRHGGGMGAGTRAGRCLFGTVDVSQRELRRINGREKDH